MISLSTSAGDLLAYADRYCTPFAMKFLDIIKTKIQSELDLIGILDGQWAFMGPELVQIDLTNACNNDCIACWCRSPLLKSDRISEDIGQQTLPFGIVRHTLEDCARMGTSNV